MHTDLYVGGGAMRNKTDGNGLKPADLYLLFSITGIVILIIMLFASNGQFLSEVIWDARNPLFVDFSSHVERVRNGRNPYIASDWDARFPPLAYLFYSFLSCIIPKTIPNSSVSDWHNMYMVILLCICVACITVSAGKLAGRTWSYALLISLVFVLSHAFALAEIKAGNSAVYVLALIMLALCLKDSGNPVKRELALILIAIAAGFKMSPAIFGLLYVKEGRYKEAVRLVIYGIIAFFVPFAAFGGLEGLKILLNISGQVSSAAIPRPETIIGVAVEIFSVLGLGEQTGLIFGRILSFAYLAVCLILFFRRKYTWKLLWLISSLMVIFVNLSYPYTLQYFLIPLVMFIHETDEGYSRTDYIYALLFALIFFTYPFIKIDWPTATFITNYFWVYVMAAMVLTDVLITKDRNMVQQGETVESDNLIFRPISREDTGMVLRWRNSDYVKNNFLYRSDITRKEHLNWLSDYVDTGRVIQFVIIEKITDKPIGSVYFRDIDRTAMKGEYGIFIGEESARGKGYGTETAIRMVRYFLDELHFRKLSLRVLEKNEIAIKSYEKAGFKVEGRMEDEMFLDGKYENLIFMAVVKKDEM